MRSARLFRNDSAVRVFRPFWDSSRSQKFGGTSLIKKNQDGADRDPYEGNYIFTECDQYTKVTVIGAAGRVGKTLSLLLKTCPLIDHLCLFDTDKSVKGIGVDISHIDTKCSVSYVCGMRNIHQALDAPDVVIVAAGCPASPTLSGRKLFEKNAPIVAGLSEACARFCPKACVVLITSPINSLLPVMGEVYQIITDRIPSRKLFGLTTLDVVRANTFVAEVVRKDPNSIIVPVIGGTSQETIVPVISQMKPCCKMKKGEMIALTECLKRAEGNLADCQNCGTRGASSLSTAYAGFRFTSSLVMALKGAENVVECAFVRSDVIPELEYLASPLKLGIRGIEYNFGYPPLSDVEEEKTSEERRVEDARATSSPAPRPPLAWWQSSLPRTPCRTDPTARGYHTVQEEAPEVEEVASKNQKPESFKDYLLADRQKTLVPFKRTKLSMESLPESVVPPRPKPKKTETTPRRQVLETKVPTDQYKNLNAAAKQKYRSFKVQKKFTPSVSAVLPTDRRRREVVGKNVEVALKEAKGQGKIKEIQEDRGQKVVAERMVSNHKQLLVKKESDEMSKYKEYIFQQLRHLKRENEELKKRLTEIMHNNNLRNRDDHIELERTKLKACWLIMSSTMEAFSNFCRKFIPKSEEQVLEEVKKLEAGEIQRGSELEVVEREGEEGEEEGEEKEKKKKARKYDESYYRFLERLLDGQLEEKKRSSRESREV